MTNDDREDVISQLEDLRALARDEARNQRAELAEVLVTIRSGRVDLAEKRIKGVIDALSSLDRRLLRWGNEESKESQRQRAIAFVKAHSNKQPGSVDRADVFPVPDEPGVWIVDFCWQLAHDRAVVKLSGYGGRAATELSANFA